MAEDKGNETLNEVLDNSVLDEAEFNQGGLGESSTPDDKPQIDPESENYINTVQDASEKEEVTEKEPVIEGQEEPGKKELSGEEDRFDKHPRFQELNTQVKDLSAQNQRLEGMLQGMKELMPAKPSAQEAAPTFEDVTGKTKEELQDWFDDDPVAFMSNFAKQVEAEVTQAITSRMQTQSTETNAKTHIQEFAEKNPGFLEKWQNGEIQQVISRSPKGFHNPISAYHEITSGTMEQTMQEKINEAVAKATKETEEKVTKNFQAKRRIAPIVGVSASKNSVENEDLKDTKKSGGLVSAIAQRILQSRQAA